MKCTIAFDIYGTLFDTSGIQTRLEPICLQARQKSGAHGGGVSAADVARLWRDKQLEYSFRRGLMQRFKDFSVCTRDALRYCNAYFDLGISAQEEAYLLQGYNELPLFADVAPSLARLTQQHHVFAFTNGCEDAVLSLLRNAGVANHFHDVISVSDTKTFKPDPAVYTHFLRQTESDPEATWLVSANSFDIIGADSVGMRTAWIRRSSDNIFDPWGVQPELTISDLSDLSGRIKC